MQNNNRHVSNHVVPLTVNPPADYKEGERIPITKKDADQVYKLVRFGAVILGNIDLTRGRVLDKTPGDWHFWNTEGKRIKFHIDPTPDGPIVIASAAKEIDPDLPEPL